jgi:hypothetical protein
MTIFLRKNRSNGLLFPEKEAKSVVLLRRRTEDSNLPRSGTTGVWGLAPKNRSNDLLFLEAWFCFTEESRIPTFCKVEPGSLVSAPRLTGDG